MADYLLPNEEIECIDEQRKIFAIRNRMVEIPANFSKDRRIKSRSSFIYKEQIHDEDL